MKGTIYKITDTHNGKIYIGQTAQSFKRRMQSHRTHLHAHTHHNELMQRVYDKYGWGVFKCEIVETCDVEKLDDRERYWIKYYDSTNRAKGYNFETGGNALKKHSPDTIEKFILTSRGENNKLTENQVTEIKQMIINGHGLTELAELYSVTVSCVYRIKNLENWEYVSPELNERLIHSDTSRGIVRLTESQKALYRQRILAGETLQSLVDESGVGYKRFCDYFQRDIDKYRKGTSDAKEKARALFMQNKSIDEILKGTGLTYPQFKRATSGMIEARREHNIEFTGKAKAQGMTNLEIAKALNVNRCTISVYLKAYRKKIS